MPSHAMGETPFFLVYGAEAVLPPKVSMGSPRVQLYDEQMQDQARWGDVDLMKKHDDELASEMRTTSNSFDAIIKGLSEIDSSKKVN
jgi:hypothetical protein